MNNIITFYGADHKCGTSMISQSIAEFLAKENAQAKILLIHAEKGDGTGYSPKLCESIENIRPYLVEKLIDIDELMTKTKYRDNLYIIGGSKKANAKELISTDMGQYFVEFAGKNFDYVVCDGGSELDQGIALGCLFSSDTVYIVCDQSENSIRRFEWFSDLYEKLKLPLSGLIVNKYDAKAVNSKELMAYRLGFDKNDVICIGRSKYGDEAEYDGKSLLSYRDKRFEKDITRIADDIEKRCSNAGE